LNPLGRDEGFQITSSSSLPGLFLAQRPKTCTIASQRLRQFGVVPRRKIVVRPVRVFFQCALDQIAAFGVALAEPDRRTILITGEGSHQLTANDIGAMGRFGANVIVFVLNNSAKAVTDALPIAVSCRFIARVAWTRHHDSHLLWGVAKSWWHVHLAAGGAGRIVPLLFIASDLSEGKLTTVLEQMVLVA
jgi:hypothetical protein